MNKICLAYKNGLRCIKTAEPGSSYCKDHQISVGLHRLKPRVDFEDHVDNKVKKDLSDSKQ